MTVSPQAPVHAPLILGPCECLSVLSIHLQVCDLLLSLGTLVSVDCTVLLNSYLSFCDCLPLSSFFISSRRQKEEEVGRALGTQVRHVLIPESLQRKNSSTILGQIKAIFY